MAKHFYGNTKYMNIQIISDRNTPIEHDYVGIHFSEINTLKTSTIDNIKCLEVVDYIEDVTSFIFLLVSKLKYGGIITVTGNDFWCIVEECEHNEQAIKKLFVNNKKSISTLELIKKEIKQNNLDIIEVFLNYTDGKYFIVGQKPLC